MISRDFQKLTKLRSSSAREITSFSSERRVTGVNYTQPNYLDEEGN